MATSEGSMWYEKRWRKKAERLSWRIYIFGTIVTLFKQLKDFAMESCSLAFFFTASMWLFQNKFNVSLKDLDVL